MATEFCRGCRRPVLTDEEWDTIRFALSHIIPMYEADARMVRAVGPSEGRNRTAEAFERQAKDARTVLEKIGGEGY